MFAAYFNFMVFSNFLESLKKHTRLLVFFFVLSTSILVQLAFQYSRFNKKELAYTYAINCKQEIEKLNELSAQFLNNQATLIALQEAVANTRLSYKKVEFLLEYYYPSYIEEHINGAPLLHIARNEAGASVIPPEGLQVLDELVFADDAKEEASEISAQTQMLQNAYIELYAGFLQKEILDIELIEAARLELVRIFTLGVTGFDTPGSLNALPEAQAALQSLQEFVLPLCAESEKTDVKNLFGTALSFVKNAKDFNTFDRLTFYKEAISPLYAKLLAVQKRLPDPRSFVPPTGWNRNSDQFFKDDFLDPYFYTELKKQDDSEALRALGKKLFNDKSLSASSKFSCGTCHKPELAFTDGEAKSQSFVDGKSVQRNSPTLINAVFADRYFYDLRAFNLEQQAEHVIFNHLEFNTAYAEILEKLNANENYAADFKSAFEKGEITRQKMSTALSSYLASLREFESEFDKFARNETTEIAPEVKRGFNLFMGKAACGTCHFAPTFAGLVPPLYQKNETEILGVLKDPNAKVKTLDNDEGRVANEIESEKAWIYTKSFKTVTVRNVEKTGPYFHNGAYKTLEEVVEFYDAGGGLGYGLEVPNQTLSGDSLYLSATEKTDLIAFMRTL